MANNNGYITVSNYPDPEGTGGVGYRVQYRTPEQQAAWQQYMDSMREHQQNSIWDNPFMQRVGQGLQAVHDFARDEIPMFSRTRQRIQELHPDAVDVQRSGSDVGAAIALSAMGTPYLGAALPYLGAAGKFLTSPVGLLSEGLTTLGLTKNVWLPWLLEAGQAAGEAALAGGATIAGGLMVDDWVRQHRNQSPDPDAEENAGRIMSGQEATTPASPNPEDPNKFKWDWSRLKPFSHYGRGQFWGNVASGLRDAAYLIGADYATSALINGGGAAISGGRLEQPIVPYPVTSAFFPPKPAPADSVKNPKWTIVQDPTGKLMVVDANDSTTRAVFDKQLIPQVPTLQTTESLSDSDFVVPAAAPAVTPAQGSSGSGQNTLNYGDPGEVERIAIPTTQNTDGRGSGGW